MRQNKERRINIDKNEDDTFDAVGMPVGIIGSISFYGIFGAADGKRRRIADMRTFIYPRGDCADMYGIRIYGIHLYDLRRELS